MEGLFAEIVTPKMAALAAAAIAIMLFVGTRPFKGKKINTTKFWKDWGVAVLIIVCVGGSFAPGINDIPKTEWGSVLVFGFVSAFVAHLGRKILKPIILNRVEGKKPKE